MKRREFLGIAGGALTWPLTAHAQQAMPQIGFFNSGRAPTQVKNLAAFREGLKEAGFVEGRNVTIEFRWGENQFDILPALAADVIARRPVLIVGNTLAARAAVMPNVECALEEVPCKTNPLGVKGIGESGTIGAPPAVINAVIDALRPLGVDAIDMPATPLRVWETIQRAKSKGVAA